MEKTFDADGKIVVIPSELLQAVRLASSGTRVGFIADELNRVQSPAAINKTLRLWGSQREYRSDLEGVLSVGRNLETIATANVGYRGTVRLNEAGMDRFDALEVSPIGGKVLQVMLEERFPSVPGATIAKVVALSDQARKAHEADPDGDIAPLSTRDAQRIVRGIQIGMSPLEAVEVLVGGQLLVQEKPRESVDALVAFAKGKLGA